MKILIAEDEPISRCKLTATLKSFGHDVIGARDGLEAWRILDGDDAPGLAVIDWMMPELDGLQLCRRLRQRTGAPYIYAIVLTANADPAQIVEGLEAGADDYLVKPFRPAELQARLRTGVRMLELHHELRTQATFDALTGVLNRGAFLPQLDREIARAEREGSPLSVVMIDLDHFKRINDTWGHPAGDEVLREASRRMKDQLRGYDAIGRYGGEEFIIALPGARAEVAARVAERLRAQVAARPVAFGSASVPVTASFGVAEYRGGGAQELISAADGALYRAKHEGRDRVVQAGAYLQAVAG